MLEPTEKVKQFLVEANELAIVDAKLIRDMNPKHPLIKSAIVFPSADAVGKFRVDFDLDQTDHVSRLTIVPESKMFAPLSHGSGADQVVAKNMNPKAMTKNRPNHAKGRDGLLNDPVKGVDAKIQHAVSRKVGERDMANPREKAKRSAANKQAALACESQNIINLIQDMTKTRLVNEDALKALSNKPMVKHVLDKLVGLSLGGWELKEGKLHNEVKGHVADPGRWDVKDGLLFTKEGKRPNIDFDVVYEACGKLQAIMSNEAASEFATIEESLAAITTTGKPLLD